MLPSFRNSHGSVGHTSRAMWKLTMGHIKRATPLIHRVRATSISVDVRNEWRREKLRAHILVLSNLSHEPPQPSTISCTALYGRSVAAMQIHHACAMTELSIYNHLRRLTDMSSRAERNQETSRTQLAPPRCRILKTFFSLLLRLR